jgi:hypothetical protein
LGERVRFNRIAKWAVRAHTQVPLELSEAGMTVNAGTATTVHDVSCELDISSPATLNGSIDPVAATAAIDTVKGYVLPILDRGDHD